MKKIFKKFCFIFFCCIFLLYSTSFTVNAQSVNQPLKSINNIAKDFAINTIKWNDVEIYNVKKLYNFNNKLVAYSIDIKNNDNNLFGYEIINANFKDNRILEFSKNKSSPYIKVKNSYKCIYEGFLNYYYENKATIYDIKSKNALNEKVVDLFRNEDKNKEYKSIESDKVSKGNDILSSSNNNLQDSNDNKTEKILDDVPDEIWDKGCVLTAVAMVLEYNYYDYVPVYDELTQELATAMGTDNNGNTYNNRIVDGIKTVMKNLGVNAYIKADGFGNHSCAGVGYEYSNTEKFIIIHDDAFDGDVYCDFNSAALGNNQWIYIH